VKEADLLRHIALPYYMDNKNLSSEIILLVEIKAQRITMRD
jgi:hypothetical protein